MSDGNIRSFNLEALKWPGLLRTPSELVANLRNKTLSSLIKSPICSKIVLQVVGGCAYILSHYLNDLHIYNKHVFNLELRLIEKNNSEHDDAETGHGDGSLNDNLLSRQISGRPTSQLNKSPLLTFSNHISCLDDPMLWACLFPWYYYSTQTESIRWSAAATDICFTNPFYSAFFSLGKTFPVLRGIGLQQPGLDFASAILNHGQWLHLFPEGRVMRDRKQNILTNTDRGYTFKWGIAKLILDYLKIDKHYSEKSIRILPFYHLGLDSIFPVGSSYVPKVGKRITIMMRPSTIELDSAKLLDLIRTRSLDLARHKSKTTDQLKLIKLTNYLEGELERLKLPTYDLHECPRESN